MKSDLADVRAWLRDWSVCVRNVDYVAARTMFAPDVIGFGTRFDMMRGLADLERRQWRTIWPITSGFKFDFRRMRCEISLDRRLACVISPWSSTGRRPNGRTFVRRGRATILLQRASSRTPWRAIHTHLSLNP